MSTTEAASQAVHSDAPAAVDSNFSQSINDALRVTTFSL